MVKCILGVEVKGQRRQYSHESGPLALPPSSGYQVPVLRKDNL